MWQPSKAICIGQMRLMSLCCLEGSTMSNLVHRRRRCARISKHTILLPGGQYATGWVLLLPRIRRIVSYGEKNRSKSLLLSLGLRPCSPTRMLNHESELPCLTLHIRLVCPQADRKPTKQNSCPWQYKMSLHRRLQTVTLDLRACPIAFLLFYHGFYGLDGIYVAW